MDSVYKGRVKKNGSLFFYFCYKIKNIWFRIIRVEREIRGWFEKMFYISICDNLWVNWYKGVDNKDLGIMGNTCNKLVWDKDVEFGLGVFIFEISRNMFRVILVEVMVMGVYLREWKFREKGRILELVIKSKKRRYYFRIIVLVFLYFYDLWIIFYD